MKFCISIGAYELLSFVELNVIQCRKVFGPEVPILLSDGKSVNSEKMEELAGKYGCFYVGEETNRGHFQGCSQNSINALVFGKQMNCDVTIKLNQRLILLRPELVKILETVFSNPDMMLALPGRPNPNQIITTKFYSHFQFLNDLVAWRVGAIDPEVFKDTYEASWRNGKNPHDCYTEAHIANLIRERFMKNHAVLNCLTDHTPGQPRWFMRKIQNTRQEFVDLAVANGMAHFEFPCSEWNELKKGNYQPRPVS